MKYMNPLSQYIADIARLCKAHKVRRLYAFGSVLTEKFNDGSDIDLVVDFDKMPVEDYADNYFDFKFSLQSLLQKPIDLLELQALKNPFFIKSITQQNLVLYEG